MLRLGGRQSAVQAALTGILNINAGNPNLRPLRSTSYDLSLEYYFSRAGYAYLTGFRSKAPGPIAGITVPLQGPSEWSYNLVGFYERGALRARAAYTWRNDYVETTSGPGSGALPIYVRPYDQLDASIGYTISDHFDISVDASNILNATTNTHFGETIRPRFNNMVDRRIGIVMRMKTTHGPTCLDERIGTTVQPRPANWCRCRSSYPLQ